MVSLSCFFFATLRVPFSCHAQIGNWHHFQSGHTLLDGTYGLSPTISTIDSESDAHG